MHRDTYRVTSTDALRFGQPNSTRAFVNQADTSMIEMAPCCILRRLTTCIDYLSCVTSFRGTEGGLGLRMNGRTD